MSVSLQVLIATFGAEGIGRVASMKLPKVAGVSYLVGWQMPHGNLPAELAAREDIRVLKLYHRGLSRNRNAVIDAATADVVLFADDDLDYTAQGLKAVINVFSSDSSLQFAAFRMNGDDEKIYPSESFTFANRLPRGYYLSSVELAVRRSALVHDLRFHTNLGIGNEWYGCGEENFLLHLMIRRGLRGKFFPFDIVYHRGLTTGNRKPTAAVLRAHGAYQRIANGLMGLPRLPIDAWRRKCSYPKALFHMAVGYATAFHHFRRNGDRK